MKPLVRIREAQVLDGFRVRLVLTDGSVVDRDLAPRLVGPVFEPLRTDRRQFESLRVDGGTLVWPNGADLCPDVIIWDGPPPHDDDAESIAPLPR